ncbi:efflux RND transporter permease subunit [Myxococcota bacterium]|nr:efflux RND transporter permease subunit [Myxococcota bacterium]
MSWIRTAIRRPVLVAVVYIVVALLGVISFQRLPVDMMPEIEPPVLSVITVYPGASARDVEQKVSQELEEAFGGISNLEEISSVSRENMSVVTLQLDFDADLDEAANEIRQAVEFSRIRLPTDIDEPRIFKFDTSKFPILIFAVTSSAGDVREQQAFIDDVILEPVRRVPGVGQVAMFNAPAPIVRIDVHRDRLVALGLTTTELARALGSENLAVPAGSIDVGAMEFAVRMPNEARSLEDLAAIVVSRGTDGTPIRLRDVATVSDGIDDTTEVAQVDGQTVVAGGVMKVSGANSVEVAEAVKRELAAIQERLPDGMRVRIVTDMSEFTVAMIANLQSTVAVGGALVIFVAFVFLRRIRPSLIVATTIPASMIVTFLLLYLAGYTLNVITLMALALAIGMVVDNGIVALENITRLVDEGRDPREAAAEGASEVGGALLAGTTTTLVIFAPLIFVSGLVGIMFEQLAYVMIVTIAGSLAVALSLTPTLAARMVRRRPREEATSRFDRLFERLDAAYERTLAGALRHPWRVFAAAMGMVVATGLLVLTVPTDFMPRQDSGEFQIVLELPVGTNLAETTAVAERITAELEQEPEVRMVFVRAGMSQSGFGSMSGGKEGSNVATISAMLVSADDRERSDEEIARAVLRRVGPLPEVVNTEVNLGNSIGRILGMGGKPVVVEVLGNDFEQLAATASDLRRRIASVEGTTEVSADLLQTRPEVRIELSPELAGRASVPFAVAGAELRAAVAGTTATRYTGGDEPKDAVVRLAPEDRDDIQELLRVPVRSMTGALVPLGDIARVVEGEAPIEVKRVDKTRIVTVSAGIEGRALGDVAADVDEILASYDAPPDVLVRYGGTVEEQREGFRDMFLLMGLGLLLVYLVMAAQFESWLDPLVITFSVPFAVTGAFLALAITRTTLSTPAFLGLIILIGVVVNNAIMLVDYTKLLQARGMSRVDAVLTSGRRRLRPVLMTTLTTVGGMFPLALATGRGAEMWGPMGRTALGGLLVSTVVTLVLVPVAYSVADGIRDRFKGRPAPRAPHAGEQDLGAEADVELELRAAAVGKGK